MVITLGYTLSSEEHRPNEAATVADMMPGRFFLRFFKSELLPLLEKEALVAETA